ncbi:RidA family protein [Streptomyces sp. N2-109]|uniref:RidA family protein n=1 Tax=Streptomyces gossypii TaxID=2883101 RepID=A0ABT2K2L6_9ACTN|nr:Rid family hydrolase [Streptomyces gossypii]MCT2594331.1 RidA family protein [Streptomyces gossypii]
MTTTPVTRVQSDSPWEETIGCAHAVAVGDRVLVSGALPLSGGNLQVEGTPYDQAKAALAHAMGALEQFGLGPDSVVRTRMYLTHTRDVDDVARAHKELFDSVRPAATVVVVSGFVDSRIVVQVEVEAYRGGGDA